MEEKKVSKSVLKRLPGYLAYLKNMPENAPAHISATALANALGMGEVQVRKDLAMVSDGGRPKIGYLRETLIDDIEQFLGYDNTTDAVLIGAGKLGQALMGYSGFDEYGLNILAAFDASPKAEKTEEGKPVRIIRNAETNLGDLCADAYRYVADGHYHRPGGGGAAGGRPAHCRRDQGHLEFCPYPSGRAAQYSGAV